MQDRPETKGQVPKEFSLLALYGRRENFRRLYHEGFTQVAHGSGDWVEELRIASIWAFYHQAKPLVETIEQVKVDTGSGTMRPNPYEKTYTVDEFDAYCKDMKVKLGKRVNFKEIIDQWELKS